MRRPRCATYPKPNPDPNPDPSPDPNPNQVRRIASFLKLEPTEEAVRATTLLTMALPTMAVLTMAVLTMALLTMALLTMALLTMAVPTMALLTMALLTMAVPTMAPLTMALLSLGARHCPGRRLRGDEAAAAHAHQAARGPLELPGRAAALGLLSPGDLNPNPNPNHNPNPDPNLSPSPNPNPNPHPNPHPDHSRPSLAADAARLREEDHHPRARVRHAVPRCRAPRRAQRAPAGGARPHTAHPNPNPRPSTLTLALTLTLTLTRWRVAPR